MPKSQLWNLNNSLINAVKSDEKFNLITFALIKWSTNGKYFITLNNFIIIFPLSDDG